MTDNIRFASLSIPWSFRFDYPESVAGVAGVGSIWFIDPVKIHPILYARFYKLEVFGQNEEPFYRYLELYFRTATALEKYVCDEVPMFISRMMQDR